MRDQEEMSAKSRGDEPVGSASHRARAWTPIRSIRIAVLLLATAVGLYVCWLLVLPFLAPLAWAIALAVLFAPLTLELETRLKRPNLAALISTVLVALIVVLPAIFVGQRLVSEAAKGVEIVRAKVESGEWRRTVKSWPRATAAAEWAEREIDLPERLSALATWLTSKTGSFLKGSLVQGLQFTLTFYLLFYLLRDRREAIDFVRASLPLSRPEMDLLLRRVHDTVFATVYGTLAVAAVQGLLGGLMFWWLGLPAPLLWGVVMTLLAIVPVLGAFVVWIPAALALLLQGSWGKALILTAWGAIVVGGVDNILRPVLVGNRLRLHTIVAFISVVGGLMLFGAAGLIIGPVVVMVTAVLLEIWRGRRATDKTPVVAPASAAVDARTTAT